MSKRPTYTKAEQRKAQARLQKSHGEKVKASDAEPTFGQSVDTSPTLAEMAAMTSDVLHGEQLAKYEAARAAEAASALAMVNPSAASRDPDQGARLGLADIAAAGMNTSRRY